MSVNKKQTSSQVASLAGKTLGSASSSNVQKSVAGSVLRQTGTKAQTGKAIETKASNALSNPRSAATTKSLAASAVSQSNKKR
ncbi:hypothetical protein [Alcaligenes faecalis]|uniref:hypothetical protein n=1 Tax=Alcaligenes faecalis TaxID=511 RepID=UPI001C833733|nr:hypothetical protein [Alcaligenes faecalis]MBX6963427.1 hypothetical protein [Providencia rettgeri]MBX7030077.1 hypothetical protein [Alcaligenes faecalis]